MQLPEHLTAENTVGIGKPVRVFLDGAEVDIAVEAHTGEGWVIRAKLNDDGEMYLEDDEAVATERLTGTVTAEII